MSTVAVLTGGTGGLGRDVARGLLRAGLQLVVIGRDAGRLAALRDTLLRERPDAQVDTERADLSLLAATAEAGAAIAARHPRIGVLVNNAGMFTTRRAETTEGHELTLATNHLSPFVLTAALQSSLAAHAAAGGEPARIVNVGSSRAERARIDLDDLELRRRWSGPRAYGRSKLLLAAATTAWARRLAGERVLCNVVHPGAVATGIVRDGVLAPLAWRLMRPFLLTAEAGAAVPLAAALAPEWGERSGRYLRPSGEWPIGALPFDAALADRVWDATARTVGA